MTYFVISNDEGDTRVRQYTREELLEEMKYERENYVESSWSEFLESVEHTDTAYWSGKKLVIKGEIVAPYPVEKVVTFDIE